MKQLLLIVFLMCATVGFSQKETMITPYYGYSIPNTSRIFFSSNESLDYSNELGVNILYKLDFSLAIYSGLGFSFSKASKPLGVEYKEDSIEIVLNDYSNETLNLLTIPVGVKLYLVPKFYLDIAGSASYFKYSDAFYNSSTKKIDNDSYRGFGVGLQGGIGYDLDFDKYILHASIKNNLDFSSKIWVSRLNAIIGLGIRL